MNEEALAAMRQKQIARMRFNYLFREAWISIARERNYVFDNAYATASHNTIARRSAVLATYGV